MAVIWVIYGDDTNGGENSVPDCVPIYARIDITSLYLSKNRWMGFKYSDPTCPTKESVEASSISPKPIGLEFCGDIIYSHGEGAFIDSVGDRYTGLELLDLVSGKFFNTVHRWRGIKLRTKLKVRDCIVRLLGFIPRPLTLVLKVCFGRDVVETDRTIGGLLGYPRSALRKAHEDSWNIVGYRAPKNVIILFCAIVVILVAYGYFNRIENGYLKAIASSNLSAIAHGVILLFLLDGLVPELLFRILNGVIKLRWWLSFLKFKVS